MKSDDIRERFLRFFEARGHARVPSSPLVPAQDPTLLFTNSGMVQFKDVFLGFDTRPYRTAATSQRCLRAGGKHNDLENVGYTARHHTFFEMLGNFSFGDYFKEKAIPYAWELLTAPPEDGGFGLKKEHLWVTVFGGGKLFGEDSPEVPADDDAAALWKKTLCAAGFSEAEAAARITRVHTADNFWMMGETGPCGPCSEIFYNRNAAATRFEGEDPDKADSCVEIWNLVFMQFNRDSGGTLAPLPAPCVDTGMGLERISAVLQNKESNFDADLFADLKGDIHAALGGAPETSASNVIADHIRAAVFMIADGILPGNEGRGYVLRRIIRRALAHGRKTRAQGEWFCLLAKPLAARMHDAMPLSDSEVARITAALRAEETMFARACDRGRAEFEKIFLMLPEDAEIFPGDAAFSLYDAFGFPIDAVRDFALEKGLRGVDEAAFERGMAAQRARSRAAMKFRAEQAAVDYDGAATEFVGYNALRADTHITALFVNGAPVKSVSAVGDGGDEKKAVAVLEGTPFYAESGGQVGDAGVISAAGGRARVLDTQKIRADVWAHHIVMEEGALQTGDAAVAEVDAALRGGCARHHSATHLLHAALRRTLGAHVAQRGSLVAADHLRFDFSHPQAARPEQLREAERIVNAQIAANAEVRTDADVPYDEALKRGAMALFGEKYGDLVRMVTIDAAFSVELCGGTHVARAGDIGYFKITGEEAVASGVRRITAVAGEEAVLAGQRQESELAAVAAALRRPGGEGLAAAAAKLRDELKTAQRKLAQWQDDAARAQARRLLEAAEDVGGVKILAAHLAGADGRALRSAAKDLFDALPAPAAVLLVGDGGGRAAVVAACDGKTMDAREWCNAAAEKVGGKGGGRAEFAQAGGANAAAAAEAAAAAVAFARARLGG